MRYVEVENHEALMKLIEAGGTLRHYAFQGTDFEPCMDLARKCRYSDCLFLGGFGVEKLRDRMDDTCAIFPRFQGLPFRVFRSGLYNAASLYEGYRPGDPDSYEDCFDSKVYRHYLNAGKQTGDIKETLARILHDHSMNDGLDDFLRSFDEKSIVGIMGGHGISRSDESFRKVVLISRKLTEEGSLMVSGGGPGAMEATHLGAWMAGRSDEDVEEALKILSAAPSYKDRLWLDAGFTCPNRDGKIGRGGCTYCDNAAFHPSYSTAGKSLHQQMDEGIEFHKVRYRTTEHYLAYFQSFSNTYAPLDRLRQLYEEALMHPSVVGIVIGTRPDCVDEAKLDYLADLAAGKVLPDWRRHLSGDSVRTAPIVIVEYGIESCYDATLLRINRGHDFETARRAIHMTASRGIDVGAHFILGLPGETRQMMLDSCALINELPLRSVKFHQLQIVKGTRMEQEYAEKPQDFERFSLDEYLDFFVDMLERLRPDLFIERFVGEVPPRFVNETPWGLIRNVELLRLLEKRLEERSTWQGRLC